MYRKNLLTLIMVLILATVVVSPARADTGLQYDLAQVRAATAAYHDVAIAEADGYVLLSFYAQCVKDPILGAMGYHYINVSLIDLTIDPLQPEAMVYTPDESGQLQLTSVEYMIPVVDWNAAHPGVWPTILGQPYNLNVAAGKYTLHAWIWHPNPAGMFASFNPKLSCD